jgi:hypothetical protein
MCNAKYVSPYQVLNVTSVIYTTNYSDALYIPANCRRHYVLWSEVKKEDFEVGHFDKIYAWYYSGGFENVAAYLASYDLSKFNPKAPPPLTKAFWTMVDANRSPEETELDDVLDSLNRPEATTLAIVAAAGTLTEVSQWPHDKKMARIVPHRFKACGYVAFLNPDAKSGCWKIKAKRHKVYVREELSNDAARHKALAELIKKQEGT